jgi:hypothetical protein
VNKRIRWDFVLLVLIISSALAGFNASAQTIDSQYFPETGHFVEGEMLKEFRKASDPITVYGFPITDEFSRDQRRYQYFEKALFIFDPQNIQGNQVRRLPLGKMLYPHDATPSYTPISTGCRVFPESGLRYPVCFAFLDFFETHGGISQFGYPISNFEQREGMIVQYFQRARLEWHPELPAGNRILLTDLGKEFFELNDENPQLLIPHLDNNIPPSVLSINVRPYPVLSVMPRVGRQSVYVVIRDQNSRPVSNAKVNMIVTLPSGEKQFHDMAVTDENGIAFSSFDIKSKTTGLVEVAVTAIYEHINEQSFSSFRIWW